MAIDDLPVVPPTEFQPYPVIFALQRARLHPDIIVALRACD